MTAEKILCVCYTNHALDSFLEDLVLKGVTSLVRIGGGSKSGELEPYLLKNREEAGFTKAQSRQFALLKGALEESQEAIDDAQHLLNRKPSKAEMLEWLEEEHPGPFKELNMAEELRLGGDTIVGRKVNYFGWFSTLRYDSPPRRVCFASFNRLLCARGRGVQRE